MEKYVLFIALALGASTASANLSCSSATTVIRGVKDDRCAALAFAAEECFDLLNQKLIDFKTLTEIGSADLLKGDFQSGLEMLGGYYPHLKKLDCGDEEAEVDVFVQEIRIDQEELRKLSAKTK